MFRKKRMAFKTASLTWKFLSYSCDLLLTYDQSRKNHAEVNVQPLEQVAKH